MSNKYSSTPYDDVFRTLLSECPDFVIPFINIAFGTSYDPHVEIIQHNNEFFIMMPDGDQSEVVTDSFLKISGVNYHLECQSSTDGTMVVMMFQYDVQIAIQDGKVKDNVYKVVFPHSAVLYLRSTKNTPEHVKIVIQVPGDSCSYEVPAIKMKSYTVDQLFEKSLYFLIPFYIFNKESELSKCDDDNDMLEKLKNEFIEICSSLEEAMMEGKITEYHRKLLLELSKKVIDNITVKFGNVQKGVGELMGGKILECDATKIKNQGKAEELVNMVNDMMKRLSKPLSEVLSILGKTEQDYNNARKLLGK